MELKTIYIVMFVDSEGEELTINSFFTTFSAAYLAGFNMCSETEEIDNFYVLNYNKGE